MRVPDIQNDNRPIHIPIGLKLEEIPEFLTDDECDYLINLATDKLTPAKVMAKKNKGLSEGVIDTDTRKADYCWLDTSIKVVKDIRQRIADRLQIPVSHQEGFHIVKYDPGGEYIPHWDYFYFRSDEDPKVMYDQGGQRTHSFLMYLNDDFTGGGTSFELHNNLTIQPKKGKAIQWMNWDTDENEAIIDSKHAGLPVETGRKWIAIVWVREGEFGKKFINDKEPGQPKGRSNPALLEETAFPMEMDRGVQCTGTGELQRRTDHIDVNIDAPPGTSISINIRTNR